MRTVNAMIALPPSPPRRQRGAASVGIALLIMFILTAAVVAVMNMSGSSVIDAAKNEEQVAALFLAESGVERAQALVSATAGAGTMTNETCTDLADGTSFPLGRGNFRYSSPASLPSSCGGATPCTSCAVTVTGNVVLGSAVTSSRVLRTTISTTPSEGLEGCGSQFTIPMPVAVPGNGAVFSHVAYRAKPSASGCSVGSFSNNARVGNCTNTGGTCNVSTTGDFWDEPGNGTNAISSMGVSAGAPNAGTDYTITTRLEEGTGGPASRGTNPSVVRDYAQTAVLFYPPVSSPQSSVVFMGSYAGNPTKAAGGYTGNVNNDWTCQPQSATTSNKMFLAAASDALVYGFSGWKANTAATSLSAVTLGVQPLRRLTSIDGTHATPVYSQIWMSYNQGYYPSSVSPQVADTTTVSGATNGANFAGAIGSTFTGTIIGASNPRTLTLTSAANLAPGSRITNSTGATVYGTLPASAATGTWGASGSTYLINSTAEVNPGATLRAYDVMTVTAVPSSGVLTMGDTITNSGGGTTYGTLGALSSGTWSAVGSTYALTSVGSPFVSAGSLQSAGKTITVPDTSVTIPAVGTAVAVSSGIGAFTSTVFTGDITGTTLTATLTGGNQLCAGDALFSGGFKEPVPSILEQGIKSNTTISSPAGCSTGPGTFSFTLSRGVDVPMSGATIIARAAVTGTPSATSFTVSRQPTTRLSGAAVVCGGVCAMFYNAAGTLPNPSIGFTLAGFASANDWSSGFACLKGIDSANIQTLGKKVAKRSSWAEVVQ